MATWTAISPFSISSLNKSKSQATGNSNFQQLENLPILDIYKFTLPNGTPDCQNDPAYDRDQVFI